MKIKKSIVSILNMMVCFVLMFDVAYAAVDDDVITTPFDLGFEITSYATSVEPTESETGLSYNLLSSSNQAYVYFHRNINQNLSSFDGIYFDIYNSSFESISLNITLSPGIGSISSVPPTTDVGKITYVEDEIENPLDDDFWHKDNHGGDGHYDKEVEDDDDDEEDDAEYVNTGISIKNEHAYFITKNGANYFTAKTSADGMIVIPSGFDGRVYVPFFSMGYIDPLAEVLLNNISSLGFTVIPTNGLSQHIQLNSYGKYSYENHHLLEQVKTAQIKGTDKVTIPAVGVSSTKQQVEGLEAGTSYAYELASSDNFVTVLDLQEGVLGVYPRALEGNFNVRIWPSDLVCLEKTVTLIKTTTGISGITSENVVADTGYISSLVYVSDLINYYRFILYLIPVIFLAIVMLVLVTNNPDSKKKSKEKE